jgi:hypothetical protein
LLILGYIISLPSFKKKRIHNFPKTVISVHARMMDLEENSGTEDRDIELLKEVSTAESQEQQIRYKKNLR